MQVFSLEISRYLTIKLSYCHIFRVIMHVYNLTQWKAKCTEFIPTFLYESLFIICNKRRNKYFHPWFANEIICNNDKAMHNNKGIWRMTQPC